MSSQEEPTGTNCLVCCMYSTATILCFAIVGLVITYYVFAIKFLVEDYRDAKDCNLDLWIYVLVSLIMAFTRSGSIKSSDDKNNNSEASPYICVLICIGLIEAGMASWGGVELWEKSCADLKESNLWTIGLVTFIVQASSAGICLVLVPLVLCCLAKNSNPSQVAERESTIV